MNKVKIVTLAFLVIAGVPLTHAQISISPTNFGNFTTTIGNPSVTQALTINAIGPIGAIVVTAPAGFEVSTNSMTGFAPSITLGKPRGGIQSVYRGSFVTHTGSVWDNGSGSEFPNESAFAAVTSNGSVVTWGSKSTGGNASIIIDNYLEGIYSEENVSHKLNSNVISVYSNSHAFAALKSNGSVITWGDAAYGGNSSSVAGSLSSNVTAVYSSGYAFAALKSDGSVVTWGDASYGGNSSLVALVYINGLWSYTYTSVADRLSSNVTAVYSNSEAFAALKNSGSVVTWGANGSGGNSTSVAESLSSNVTAVYSNSHAFAALKKDGSVVTWGGSYYVGGYSPPTVGGLSSNIATVYSTERAFAALKSNGSVVTWGDANYGGNSNSVADSLSSNVTAIYSNRVAFAALKSTGSVVTWGGDYGGNSNSVADRLSSNVIAVYSNLLAFAALKKDGSVVTWGEAYYGGNSTSVASSLSSNVTAIYSNTGAFAALKKDGSVVTWGDTSAGGNSSSVADSLGSGVIAVYSTKQAFAALKSDGSIVSWGLVRGKFPTGTEQYISGAPANIGASISGLPSQIYVRLASSAQASFLSGELVFSSLSSAADDNMSEIETLLLSGTIQSAGGYTGSPNTVEASSSNITAPAQVKKPKKGGKSSSAKKSSGGSSKKASASKSPRGKKSGANKKKNSRR
jgi:uncharacterized glyoxalase superfamily protein PhnB